MSSNRAADKAKVVDRHNEILFHREERSCGASRKIDETRDDQIELIKTKIFFLIAVPQCIYYMYVHWT